MTTADIEVPPNVAAAVREQWGRGDDWAAQVKDELEDLCKRHRATPVRVLPARYGFVVATDSAHGPLVMRTTPDPAGQHQAVVAFALADLGVGPAIHDVTTTDSGTWTVMEQVIPGTTLADSGVDALPLDALTLMLRPMIGQPAPQGIPRIEDWLRDRLVVDDLTDAAPTLKPVPAHQRQAALRLIDDLAQHGQASLCHGDTSWGNVLLGPSDQLFLIDPRGMSGDVAYDAAVVALKAGHLEPPETAADRVAKRVGLDPARVQGWLTVARAARV